MADNVQADAGSGGSIFAAASLSFSGDTTVVPLNALGILSGSEGSWTYTVYVGGAGAVTAGTQRVTLASDDPAVASLAVLDDWDESDRAKVNPIVGQAGVQGGSGTTNALTQRVVLATDVALPAGTNAIGKLAANSGVDIGDVDILSIAAGDNNIGNVDIVTVPADPFGVNADAASATGSISAKLRFIAATGIPITGTVTVGAHAVTNAGVFVVQVDGTALTRLTDIETNTDSGAVVGNGAAATAQRVTLANDSTGLLATVSTVTTVTTLTGGGVAHDSADSGNPHKIGGKATTSLAGLTLVANADRTDLFAGIDGVQIVRGHSNLEDIVTATPVAITDGASTSVLASQGAGVKFYLTELAIANSSASNVTVDLRDGTAGAVKWTVPVPAGGGVVKTFSTPLPFSADTAVAADPSAAASTITVSVLGFKSKV